MDHDTDELNRLISRGLDYWTARAVQEGSLDESLAVAEVQERRAVEKWLAGLKTLPSSLTPLWDLAPERFYWAFDGARPDDPRPVNFVVVDADVGEVLGKLTYASSRAHDPWHEGFRRKTSKTAYRWQNRLPVTPPLIADFEESIHIVGGMHRFHLAAASKVNRMPFLVDGERLDPVLSILSTAKERETET